MITEYCSHGDLLNFLRTHAQDIMASILSFDEVEGGNRYKNMAARLRRSDTKSKPNSLKCSEKLNVGRVTVLANIS